MKSFNRIVLLLSFMMVSIVCAMEVEPTQSIKCFVDIDNKVIEDYIEGAIRYYDEYKAREFHHFNVVSFPIHATDPLPIEFCGGTRFFITSAIHKEKGEVFSINDPAIDQLAVVCGTMRSNNEHEGNYNYVNVYLGLKTDEPKLILGQRGYKNIYKAKVMALQIVYNDGQYPRYQNYFIPAEVAPFGAVELHEEINKRFAGKAKQGKWQSLNFSQEKVKCLLGKYAKRFDCEKQEFNFEKCYWTKTKNKLKGITYRSEQK